ncbi:MAG TPA: hypothetical protein VD815_06680 [Candidatus Saccharimonadales bacterium]|nr:hypothetical protein [Candidatus Saccharimonadales bacterium]
MRGSIDENNKGNCHDKIKHMVKMDDDVLAVFTMISSRTTNLYIA